MHLSAGSAKSREWREVVEEGYLHGSQYSRSIIRPSSRNTASWSRCLARGIATITPWWKGSLRPFNPARLADRLPRRQQADRAVGRYISGFYNPVRRHSALDFTGL